MKKGGFNPKKTFTIQKNQFYNFTTRSEKNREEGSENSQFLAT